MTKRSKGAAHGLVLVSALMMMGGGVTAGCSDDDAAAIADGKGGSGGEAAGRAGGGEGGATHAIGGSGSGGANVGGAGGAPQCDCGSDVDQATIPLSCACAAGLCTTFDEDLAKYQSPNRFGWPYYVLLGTCASGYHTLSYEEALEQGGRRTYDAKGNMVYDSFGGYDGVVPDACGFDDQFSLGSVTIGEDPSQDCSYCLLAGEDGPPQGSEGGAGGLGGASGGASGSPDRAYPESNTPPCDPSLFK